MSTLAHPRLDSRSPDEVSASTRGPLHAAVPVEAATPLWTRLRHPFARRLPTVRSLIRRYRLWPAMEFVYDELVEEFGRVRLEMKVSGEEERFPYVCFQGYAPTVEMEHLLALEEDLSERVTDRFGRAVSLRILIILHSDPDYLPLFA